MNAPMLFVFRMCLVSLLFFGIHIDVCRSQSAVEPTKPSNINESSLELRSVQSGLNGVWKVGYETQHRFTLFSSNPHAVEVQLWTVDGDGVQVHYHSEDWRLTFTGGEELTVSAIVKHGRSHHPIVLRVVDRSDANVLLEHELTAEERGTPIPSDLPWVVGIGTPSMGLDSAVLHSTRSSTGNYFVTELTESAMIPANFAAMHGVDLLVFSSSNRPLLEGLKPTQVDAIRNWIWHGGRCLLTIGTNADAWFKHEHFANLVPGAFEKVSLECRPGPLESYLNSDRPLKAFSSAILRLPETPSELTGQESDRTPYPLMAKWTKGLGKVRWLAVEIDSPEIHTWESQTALIKLIMNDQWEGRGHHKTSNQPAVDLSIQLGNALNRFQGLQIGNLTQMSVLMGVLLAILGPFDYFVIARRWNRPRLTWLSLIGVALLSCGLLIYLQKLWKPTNSQVNSVELVDVDVQSGEIFGRAFAHFYGGPRGTYSLEVSPSDSNIGLVTATSPSENSDESEVQNSRVVIDMDWLGQPGKGLGGFDSTVATDRSLPPYEIYHVQPGAPKDSVRGIKQLGVPEAGTKAFECRWDARLPSNSGFGNLVNIAGAIDMLNGHVSNPLPCDLINGIVIYRGRFYTLPLRMRTGDRVEFSVNVVPKDFTRRLQRRVNIDGKDQGTPWEAGEANLNRILEMLAFHRSSGGNAYTGMVHRYLAELEQSEILKTERAIIFAELDQSQLHWNAQRGDKDLGTLTGMNAAVVRILLPVASPNNSITSPSETDE